jgi:hypothetical protein
MDEPFADETGITFGACLYKITTLVDGGVRVSFDIPETQLQTVLKLASLRGQYLQVGVVTPDMITK